MERLLIFSLPGVSWSDLERVSTPNLDRFLNDAAIADMTPRTLSRTDASFGYVTMSAGTRARSSLEESGAALGATTVVRTDDPNWPAQQITGSQLFEQRTGRVVDRGIVHLGIGSIIDANAAEDRDIQVGALGDAISDAGYLRGVIANADEPGVATSPAFKRDAVSALMSSIGRLPGGAVDDDLLRNDPSAPFSVRLDHDAVLDEFRAVWTPRSVTLVEASDLVRAESLRPLETPEHRGAAFDEALRRADKLFGRLLAEVDVRRDGVLVVGPSRPASSVLSVAALVSPGTEPGLLKSSSTRRAGFVLLTDVAPSVLDLIGVEAPSSMAGQAFTVEADSGPVAERRAVLVKESDAAAFRDQIRLGTVIALTVFCALMSIGAVVLLVRGGGSRFRAALKFAAFMVLGFVPAVYLARLIHFYDLGFVAYGLFLAALAVAFGFAYARIGRRDTVDGLIAALGTIAAILVLDVISGATLQLSSAFGYAPTVGARIAGFGNVSYAFLASSGILLAGLLAHRFGRRGAQVGVVVLLLALIADVAPFWGADVGGALSMVPALAITALMLLGIRFRWRLRTVVILVGTTLLVLAAVTTADMLRPIRDRTHLGRTVQDVYDKGLSHLGDVIGRKFEQNLESLVQSEWRPMVLIVLAFVAFLLWAPPRWMRQLVATIPELRPTLIGFTVLAILGYALNDSGISVPGVMLTTLDAVLVALFASRRSTSDRSELSLEEEHAARVR